LRKHLSNNILTSSYLLALGKPNVHTRKNTHTRCHTGSSLSGVQGTFTCGRGQWRRQDPSIGTWIHVPVAAAPIHVGGGRFEDGGFIIHTRNLHVRCFADLLGLAVNAGDDVWGRR
jgi:hypothetical protein